MNFLEAPLLHNIGVDHVARLIFPWNALNFKVSLEGLPLHWDYYTILELIVLPELFLQEYLDF